MEDSILSLIAICGPVVAIALAWGRFQGQVKQLASDNSKLTKEFETHKADELQRSYDLNLKLTDCVGSLAIATRAMTEFDERRKDQIDANTRRSRSNRARIEVLEGVQHAATTARMRAAGVPEDLTQEISGQISRRPIETSTSTPRPGK